MVVTMEMWIQLIFVLGMALALVAAFFIGNMDEKRHHQNLLVREKALSYIVVLPVRRLPESFSTHQLVLGSVVMSSNQFTRMLAMFRHFWGGHIRSYEALLERARREAILRMKEEAAQLGADMILNIKFETTTLGNVHDPRRSGVMGTVEVLVYGTAGKMHDTV